MISYRQWQMSETEGEMGATKVLKLKAPAGRDRRRHRRHDLESRAITIDRWDGRGGMKKVTFGRIVDLSAGGVRVRTPERDVAPDQQIRVRIELPAFAGIHPFVDSRGGSPQPSRAWVGWMAVSRVDRTPDGGSEVAGRLVDMEDMDRGMLGLYLSTQPLAA